MTDLLKRFAKLIDLKSIVTILITIYLCKLTYENKLDVSVFASVAGSVFAFYFSKNNIDKQ